jgi:hypothetical protein
MPKHFVDSNQVRFFLALALICLALSAGSVQAEKGTGGRTVRLLTRDGKVLEGNFSAGGFTVNGGPSRSMSSETLLSISLAADASAGESERIGAAVAAVQGSDRAARDAAVAELTDIGLPALTPVLNAYKDRDMREPDPLYRLFGRLIPGYADALDRSLDLVRLKNGEVIRGKVGAETITLQESGGSAMKIPFSSVRTLAVRQAKIEKGFDLQALRHCTQIEFLDTGVVVGPKSRVEVTADGFVRLSYAIDGWASDPDGLKVPGPNYKTTLVDGFPFGAVVGKVGAAGPRFFVGRRLDKTGLGAGRLYLAVNDNPHWQNNIGSFRVKLRVSDAYDVGDPQ